jgi:hypothetical protein
MERKKSTKEAAATKKPAARKRTAPRKATTTAVPEAVKQPRRAVFIDVENTSGEADLLKVLEHLKIDRTAQPTELTAVGNWRSVGARVARMLAGLGAHLVHSAPAAGVRDWSDLWIAVAAGRWLAGAAAGDSLDVVSDDRAFDAVGDAAAAAGVVFKRISYRSLPGGTHAAHAAHAAPAPSPRPRRSRRRRHHDGARPSQPAPTDAPHVSAPAPASAPHAADEAAHAASHEQIRALLARLSNGGRWINLDILANALRSEGFTRPPGSPRLVTRLRKMKDVEVTPNGMVRLVGEQPQAPATETEPTTPPAQRRPRRRGGRGRRRSGGGEAAPPAEGGGTI